MHTIQELGGHYVVVGATTLKDQQLWTCECKYLCVYLRLISVDSAQDVPMASRDQVKPNRNIRSRAYSDARRLDAESRR